MKMVRVEGREDLGSFVKNKWGILEPANEREDVYSSGLISGSPLFSSFSSSISSGGHLDLILCPGLGFDTNNHRLGRGLHLFASLSFHLFIS